MLSYLSRANQSLYISWDGGSCVVLTQPASLGHNLTFTSLVVLIGWPFVVSFLQLKNCGSDLKWDRCSLPLRAHSVCHMDSVRLGGDHYRKHHQVIYYLSESIVFILGYKKLQQMSFRALLALLLNIWSLALEEKVFYFKKGHIGNKLVWEFNSPSKSRHLAQLLSSTLCLFPFQHILKAIFCLRGATEKRSKDHRKRYPQ